MKLHIANLGPVKEATIDLSKKLTVFCGPNGTGKTWVSYMVYGVLGGRTTMTDPIFDEQDVVQILREGHAVLETIPEDIYRARKAEINQIAEQISRIFPVAVDRQRELFSDFRIDVGETESEFIRTYERMELDVAVSFGPADLSIQKAANSTLVSVRMQKQKVVAIPQDFFELALTERLLTVLAYYPILRSVIFPVERNSIYTFGKEVALYRMAIYDRLRGEKNPQGAFDYIEDLKRQATRYPEAIRDAMRDADDAANLARSASPFYEFAREVETNLLHGKVGIGEDGEITFTSDNAAGKSFSFQLSSSAVKTISPLILYLKHQAQLNDLIIIDEPELNLHPDNQILLVRLFARMMNQGLRLLISTHSDYIVRELNNLIMLSADEIVLKKIAKDHGYREGDKISREDIGVYLFHLKKGESRVTVESVPVADNGFEIETIENTINNLNAISEELFYYMRYGHRHRDEEPA